MKVYVGQTRGATLIDRLTALGFGEMTVRGQLQPRREPWAFDNGAFGDWRAGRAFDTQAYCEDLARLGQHAATGPDLLVVPDIVAGGERSLEFSLDWLETLRDVSAPRYLAVQDGMAEASVQDVLELFDGLFVGGTLAWKILTGRTWVEMAHRVAKPCHVGRVGSFNRVRWARRIGADSIDSCLPLWSEDNLQRFIEALSGEPHPELVSA